MNKNIIISKFISLGFSKLEAQVYIACLQTGTAPVSVIAENAKINRVTVYDIIDKLVQRGVVTLSSIKNMKHFTPIDPKMLVDDLEQQARELKLSLPFLESLAKKKDHHPTVRYFEGLQGIKKSYIESLDASTEILNYANSKNIRLHWPEYDEEYVQKRKERKIFLRGLAPDDEFGKRVQKGDSDFFRETRLIKKSHFAVENEINIYDNIFMIASYEPNPFAIVIESSAVADTQRQIFEVLWKQVKNGS